MRSSSVSSRSVGKDVLLERLQSPELGMLRKASTPGTDLNEVYNKWSESYVSETANAGYVAPRNTSAIFREHLPDHLDPNTAKVLDCGCGTGLVAEHLVENVEDSKDQFMNLHGLDFSPGMLKLAKAKPYVSLQEGNVLERMDIEDDEFDALICVGLFCSGHVGPEALEQLMRIVKPGGIATISIQEHILQSEGFPAEFDRLAALGICTIVDKVEITTMSKLDTLGVVYTFKIL